MKQSYIVLFYFAAAVPLYYSVKARSGALGCLISLQVEFYVPLCSCCYIVWVYVLFTLDPLSYSTIMSGLFLLDQGPFRGANDCPYVGLHVPLPVGFKARVVLLLAFSLACAQ